MLLCCVGVLDDARHTAIPGPDHTAIASGVVDLSGQQGDACLALSVRCHQGRQRRGRQQRGVARQHHDVVVVKVCDVVEGAERHADRITSPALLCLHREGDLESARCELGDRLDHMIRLVTHDDDDPVDVELGERVDHVQHHWPSTDAMEGFGERRAHP